MSLIDYCKQLRLKAIEIIPRHSLRNQRAVSHRAFQERGGIQIYSQGQTLEGVWGIFPMLDSQTSRQAVAGRLYV